METTVIAALIAAIASIIVAVIQYLETQKLRKNSNKILEEKNTEISKKRTELENLKLVERSFHEPVSIAKDEHRNSIILLGIGNSGKSEFIHSVLDAPDANPLHKTMDYAIYHKVFEPADLFFAKIDQLQSEKRRTNFYISDYKGQNIGNLISQFLFQQKIPYSPMADSGAKCNARRT